MKPSTTLGGTLLLLNWRGMLHGQQHYHSQGATGNFHSS
jgi:hypothetical protein